MAEGKGIRGVKNSDFENSFMGCFRILIMFLKNWIWNPENKKIRFQKFGTPQFFISR